MLMYVKFASNCSRVYKNTFLLSHKYIINNQVILDKKYLIIIVIRCIFTNKQYDLLRFLNLNLKNYDELLCSRSYMPDSAMPSSSKISNFIQLVYKNNSLFI